MTDIEKILSDKKKWKLVAKRAEERRERLQSFGTNALGVLVRTRQGLFVVDPEDAYVSAALLHKGVYNLSEYELAKSLVTKKSDVLVVGAHIGAHAIALSRDCRHLVAIEANPHTYTFLRANILLNERPNIEAHNIAAGESVRKIQFLVNRANSGGSKRGPLKAPKAAYIYDNPETIRIDAVPLDKLLGAKTFDLIIMDIEGSEYFALKGMQQILAKAKALSIEFLPHLLRHASGVTPQKLLRVIQPYFEWLYIPESKALVPKPGMARTLNAMYRSDEGHDGLYFLKNPLPKNLSTVTPH
jgi:FkbM family methyltransferase